MRKRNVLMMLLAMCVLVAGLPVTVFAQDTGVPSSLVAEPRQDEWWQQRHAAMNARVQQGDVDLLFIGDSITHGWEGAGSETWNQYYADRKAVNLGISGDRTQHVIWRLENGNLEGISPKLAVLMIGTNNYQSNTAEEIGAGMARIIEILRGRFPECKVLLLAIFPRMEKPGAEREKLALASAFAAEQTAKDPMVHFLDIGPRFLAEDGTLPKDIMPDFLHPNEKGYRIWAEAIEAHLATMLGEAAAGKLPKGFTALFNGKDLSGWEEVGGGKKTWGVDDGMLYTEGGKGGWLSTDREYADFELMLEFRVPPNGNSGVFARTPRQGNPAFEGFEVQVLDDDATEFGELKPWQFSGSIYATVAPSHRATKAAGEWQTMYIRAQGSKVSVCINGQGIIDADLKDHLDKLPEHPGLARTSGYIGLQNHGSRLDYRNLWIREL